MLLSLLPLFLLPEVVRRALAKQIDFVLVHVAEVQHSTFATASDSTRSPGLGQARNPEWFHMLNREVTSMPDKWEYPWYAAWDLAFHTIVFSEHTLRFPKSFFRLGDFI